MKWGRVRNYKSTRFRQNLIKLRLKIAKGIGIPYSLLFNDRSSKEPSNYYFKTLNIIKSNIKDLLLVHKLPRKLKKKVYKNI